MFQKKLSISDLALEYSYSSKLSVQILIILTTIVILILVIILLLGVIAYIFVIQPSINGYVVQKQGEAVDQVLTLILAQVQQQGFTQLTDRNVNQTIILVPYVPQQQGQTPAQNQQPLI